MGHMKSVEEIRRENLSALRAARGGRALADQLGRSESQISQWIKGSINSGTGKPRNMRSETARWIESTLGLEHMWLDSEHAETGALYLSADTAQEHKPISYLRERDPEWPFQTISIARFFALPPFERGFVESELNRAIAEAESRLQNSTAAGKR